MRKNKSAFVLISFLFSFSILRAQLFDTIGASSLIYKDNYLHYLLISNENTKAALVNFNIQYLYMPKVEALATGGLHINIGVNLARFFTRKFILGVSADVKFFLGYTQQPLPKEFVDDFNKNFIYSHPSKKDSARAYTLKEAINHTNGYGIKGNNFGNYGISFSPFPDRWGAFLLQVKYGYRNFPFLGPLISDVQNPDVSPYFHLILKDIYTVELSFKPYKFFNSKFHTPNELRLKNIYKHILISLYYERLNFKNATFNNTPLTKYVDQSFINKYSGINQFGIKLGLGIY